MNVVQVRSNGYAVQALHFAAEEAAFQTCVDGQNLRFLTVEILVYGYHGIPKLGLMTVLPARVIALLFVGSAHEFNAVAETVSELQLFGFHGASHAEDSLCLSLLQAQNTQIQGCLYQSCLLYTSRCV